MSGEGGIGPEIEQTEAHKKVTDKEIVEKLGSDNVKYVDNVSQMLDRVVNSPHEQQIRTQEREAAKKENQHPNAIVQKFIDQADAELESVDLELPPQEEVEKGLDTLEDFANYSSDPRKSEQNDADPTDKRHIDEEIESMERSLSGPNESKINLPSPEQTIRKLDDLPLGKQAFVAAIFNIAPTPEHIMERHKADPESEVTSEELTEIYEGIKNKLDQDPKAAKFEDLMTIIDSEIAETETSFAESTSTGLKTEDFTNPDVIKYNSLSKCRKAIKKLMKGKNIKATSSNAIELDNYLRNRIDLFKGQRKRAGDNPEKRAQAEAGLAFFDALHSQTPD